MWGQTTWCRFKTSQWHLQIEPNYCVKHLIVFKKSKYERTFWNNWYEKHSKWLYHKNIRKCKIQNEIITSINNLKVPNTLMLSLQQKVSKSVNNSNLKCVERFVTHPTVNCAASLKRRSIFLTTVILLSLMIGSNGITTWFSKPFCPVLPGQTSMMCSLRDIEVMLYYSTNQSQTYLLLKIRSCML